MSKPTVDDTIPPDIEKRLNDLLGSIDHTSIQPNEINDTNNITDNQNEQIRNQLTDYLHKFQSLNILDTTQPLSTTFNNSIYEDTEIQQILADEKATEHEMQKLTELLSSVTNQADTLQSHHTTTGILPDTITSTDNNDVFALTSIYDVKDTDIVLLDTSIIPSTVTQEQHTRLATIDSELAILQSNNKLIHTVTKGKPLSSAQIHYLLTHPNVSSTTALNELSAITQQDKPQEVLDIQQLLQHANKVDEYSEFVQSRAIANQIRTERSKSNNKSNKHNTNDVDMLSDSEDEPTIRRPKTTDIHMDQLLTRAVTLSKYTDDNDELTTVTHTPRTARQQHDKSRITVEQKLSRMLDKINDIQHNVKIVPTEYRNTHNKQRNSLSDKSNTNRDVKCRSIDKQSFLPNIGVRPPSTETSKSKT